MSFFIQTRLILRYRHSSPASRSQELSQLKTDFQVPAAEVYVRTNVLHHWTVLHSTSSNRVTIAPVPLLVKRTTWVTLLSLEVMLETGSSGERNMSEVTLLLSAGWRLFQNRAPFLSITHANWWPILEITNALYWLQWIWGSYQTCPGGLPNCSGREYACRIVVVIFNKLILAWNLWKNIPNWSIWISLTPVSN